jgi:secreted PhoX family phosphatase
MRTTVTRWTRRVAVAAIVAAAIPAVALGAGWIDLGVRAEARLANTAADLYGGIKTPLAESSVDTPGALGASSVGLARGLAAKVVPTGDKLASNADMIAFWPTDTKPEWAIVCIENGETIAGVQRVKLRGSDTGKVETMLTGTRSCDGIRRTPWNTIVATEEVLANPTRPAGWALEIYNPSQTAGVRFNRVTGELTGADAGNVKPRPALGRFAWEGLHVFDDGTVIAGDELAPSGRKNGGALFKFVSDQPASAATIATLANPANHAQSPFAAGKLYALEVGLGNAGQGNQYGKGKWVGPIDAANATAEGQAKGTGYYRPEDLHADPIAAGKGERRVCWTNTGNSSLNNWGEILCMVDAPDAAAPTGTTPEVQQFVIGDSELNQPDNIAFQPKTGIVYIIQDTPRVNGVAAPGDVWACLRDGADRDHLTDGCVRVVSVKSVESEPTGFIFDGSGEKAYINIQHSGNDATTPTIDEATFDEMLEITGFAPDEARAVR